MTIHKLQTVKKQTSEIVIILQPQSYHMHCATVKLNVADTNASIDVSYFREDKLPIPVDGKAVVNDYHLPIAILAETYLIDSDLWIVLPSQHNVLYQFRTLCYHS